MDVFSETPQVIGSFRQVGTLAGTSRRRCRELIGNRISPPSGNRQTVRRRKAPPRAGTDSQTCSSDTGAILPYSEILITSPSKKFVSAGSGASAMSETLSSVIGGRARRLEDRERGVLDAATRRFGLSERARHRILKVARPVADPAGAEPVDPAHLSEAIGLRVLDRDAGPL